MTRWIDESGRRGTGIGHGHNHNHNHDRPNTTQRHNQGKTQPKEGIHPVPYAKNGHHPKDNQRGLTGIFKPAKLLAPPRRGQTMELLKVFLKTDSQGNIHGTPVNPEDADRIIAGMTANGYEHYSEDFGPLFIQNPESNFEVFDGVVADDIPRLPTVYFVDEWTFRHRCGYQSD